ncbi:hypothetical protein B0E51_16415 [Rhodanobacter sp. C05]|nr:hypothetical protein B0E51_16415 [Rhodanobacter sp. C05]
METPEFIGNRPALPAIAYRVGRYATFDASMLACLSQSTYTPMTLLRTRDSGDFTIGLLDSWAGVLDILTFYQERFANEAYLRTAIDRRSVFELSRLIGYVPSPGVSATDVLAFTLSDAPGSPDNVVIPAGTRVQSVPGPNQTPQVFETSTAITALIGYNALPAQTSQAWVSAGKDSSTWIQGTANSINVGDVLLFVKATNGVANNAGPAEKHTVVAVNPDSTNGITQLVWDGTLSASFPAGTTAAQLCLYVFRKKAALYGVQAPAPGTFPSSTLTYIAGHPSSPSDDWNYDSYTANSDSLNLDAAYTGLLAAAGTTQWALLTSSKVGDAILRVTSASESNPNRYTLTTKTSRLTFQLGQLPGGGTSASALNAALVDFEKDTRNVTVYIQTTPLKLADLPVIAWSGTYPTQSGMVAPVGGSSLAIGGGQQIAVGQPIGISGRRARVQVLPGAAASFAPAQSSASLTVSDNQVFLIDAYPPTAGSTSGVSLWSVITVSGASGTLRLNDNYVLLVPSDKNDPATSEANDVSTTTVDGDITTLALGNALTRLYDATTVNVNANAVNASNGETVQELLGSGDATNAALTFTLKQSPLTYASSTGANGTQSTLQVWVNNIQWHEVPNLLSSGPTDRVFVTRVNQTGFTVVQFGDGANGARTPTGQMNIRAVYRKGIGSAGMVAAGQLSQPLDRPQGLRTVTNPGAAAGGADPATADDARASAPLPTLTIGRVVSLEDYQNYALNFGGIAKATASWTFFNGTRGVFLTVAGANGATFEPTDTVILNLIDSLHKYGNKYVPLYVASYDPVLFQVGANIKIDDDNYDPTLVLAQAWQNLVAAFAFAQCQLAQNVAASDIVEIVQQTPGVIALQLTALFLSGSPSSTVPAQLCAAGALPPQGAQMLLLDPACQNAIGAWT